MVTKEACESCRFWGRYDEANGYCKRRAPIPIVSTSTDEVEPIAHWPETYCEDWCGEFEPKRGDA